MADQPVEIHPALGHGWVATTLQPLRVDDGAIPEQLVGDAMMIELADDFVATLELRKLLANAPGGSERIATRVPQLVATYEDPSTDPFTAAFSAFDASSMLMWSDPDAAVDLLWSLGSNLQDRHPLEVQLQAYLRIASMLACSIIKTDYEGDALEHCADQVIYTLRELDLPATYRYRALLFACWLWCVKAQQGRTLSDWFDAKGGPGGPPGVMDALFKPQTDTPGAAPTPPNVLAVRAWLRALIEDPVVPQYIAEKARLLLADSLLCERYSDRFEKAGASFRTRALKLLEENVNTPGVSPVVAARSRLLHIAALSWRNETAVDALTLLRQTVGPDRERFACEIRTLLEVGVSLAGLHEPAAVIEFQSDLDALPPQELPPLPPFPPQ